MHTAGCTSPLGAPHRVPVGPDYRVGHLAIIPAAWAVTPLPSANIAAREFILRSMVPGYFGFFVFLWIYTHFHLERTKPVPERLTFDH